ncbi:fimbrial protein [Enterobacter hormaechei]|uniref:fimbrial protein n=1 Tax=Enterobacter hormaechei TaxID=158836 RepID=UPI0039E73CE1
MKNLYTTSATVAFLAILFSYSSNVHAVDSSWLPGECRPLQGTKQYTFNFVKTINDVSENESNKSYDSAFTWADNSNYNIGCNCVNFTNMDPVYFKAETTLPPYMTINNKSYYKISQNLAVAMRSYVSQRGHFEVPFEEPNLGVGSTVCTEIQAKSGSEGELYLLITSPFLGQVTIPTTNILNVYGSTVKGSFGTIPLAKVNIVGSVTVQQSCEINAGQSIQVDFGDMFNGNFKGKGLKPEGVSSKKLQLGYKCYLVSKGMDVKMRFTGQNDSNYPIALSTTNPDIGVVIEDGNGNPVQPNTGTIPMTVDYDTQTGSVDITTYPVSTTGNIPVVGQFTSRATVVVDFQ